MFANTPWSARSLLFQPFCSPWIPRSSWGESYTTIQSMIFGRDGTKKFLGRILYNYSIYDIWKGRYQEVLGENLMDIGHREMSDLPRVRS